MKNIEKDLKDPMTKSEPEPRFPDDDVWLDDMEKFTSTVIYSDIDEQIPTNINHLSKRTRYVVAGDGVATIGNTEISFSQSDSMTVPKGVPTSLIGRCSLLTTIEPILIPRFCTLGDQKLSREDKRALKKVEKSIATIQRTPVNLETMIMKMMYLERQFSAYQTLANKKPYTSKR